MAVLSAVEPWCVHRVIIGGNGLGVLLLLGGPKGLIYSTRVHTVLFFTHSNILAITPHLTLVLVFPTSAALLALAFWHAHGN